MAAEGALEVKVGLLVVAGMAAAGILIVLSEVVNFENEYAVAAYLDNASGLLVGSQVTLTGLRIGRVARIEPSSDPRGPIRVEMRVLARHRLHETSPLTVSSNGILGDKYLEFAAPGEPPGALLPQDGSAEVEADPDWFGAIAAQAGDLLDRANAVLSDDNQARVGRVLDGAARLTEESADTVVAVRARLERVDEVLSHLERVGGQAQEVLGDLHQRAGAGLDQATSTLATAERELASLGPQLRETATAIEETVVGARDLVERGARLLGEAREPFVASLADLRSLAAGLAALGEDLRAGRGFLGELLTSQSLSRDLHRVMLNLSQASELIADSPSVLVWGQTEEERRIQARARDAMRRRRAFMDGNDEPPPDRALVPIPDPPRVMRP